MFIRGPGSLSKLRRSLRALPIRTLMDLRVMSRLGCVSTGVSDSMSTVVASRALVTGRTYEWGSFLRIFVGATLCPAGRHFDYFCFLYSSQLWCNTFYYIMRYRLLAMVMLTDGQGLLS